MKVIIFKTHTYANTIIEQKVRLSDKTAVVYSRSHPRKGTKVITRYFLEALRAYLIGRQGINGAVRTNYVDIDNVLDVYNDIIQHEEELLLKLMLGQ